MFRLLVPVLLFSAIGAAAQTQPAQSPTPNNSPNNIAPNDLVRRVVQHELKADSEDHTLWTYKDVVNLPAPSHERTVIETQNGDLTCLEQIGNHPLTPEQRQTEAQRIHTFVADASAQRRALKASNADDQKSARLFAMLPDAFLFTAAGTNGDTAKLTFEPNPAYHAHSMEEFVFHKMSGFVIVNTRENRLVEIAGTLTHGVEFAGGLFGHLDPGGAFDVRLIETAPNVWKITSLKVNMRGRVLFFKTIGDQEDETRTDFRPVPDNTTMAQAEQMLNARSAGKAPGNANGQ